MLAKFPTDGKGITKKVLDQQLLRLGIIAELDAIDLYEQLAAATSDKKIKAVFLDVAREEKTHVGEFMALLLDVDKEQ
ncbi:MAG TPA: ferritin family protein, partial [Thermoplasmata archaeon]